MSRLPQEQPPIYENPPLQEWLTRLVIQINGLLDARDEANAAQFMPVAPNTQTYQGVGVSWVPQSQLSTSPFYKWSSDTTAADPGPGFIRANNANPALITEVYISSFQSNGGTSAASLYAVGEAGDFFSYTKSDDNFNNALFRITGDTVDNGGWFTVPVTVESNSGGFGDGDDITIVIVATGGRDHDISYNNDVDTVTIPPLVGDLLQWDGVNWVPFTLTLPSIPQVIDDLLDVDTTTTPPVVDDFLRWDGVNWVPYSLPPRIIQAVASGKDPDTGDYLGWGSEIQGNSAGYCVPFDADVNLISTNRTNSGTQRLQIRVNNSVEETIVVTSQQQVHTVSLTLDAGDEIEVRNRPNNSSKIENPVVALVLEERV